MNYEMVETLNLDPNEVLILTEAKDLLWDIFYKATANGEYEKLANGALSGLQIFLGKYQSQH